MKLNFLRVHPKDIKILQADKMRKLLVDTTGSSGPVENLRKIIGEKALPILPNSSPQILPIFRSVTIFCHSALC